MSVYESVFRQLEYLREVDALTIENEALGELALNLAKTLDQGAGLAAAAVSRELRGTLQEIARAKADEDDEWAGFVSGLSVAGISPLGHPKN